MTFISSQAKQGSALLIRCSSN